MELIGSTPRIKPSAHCLELLVILREFAQVAPGNRIHVKRKDFEALVHYYPPVSVSQPLLTVAGKLLIPVEV